MTRNAEGVTILAASILAGFGVTLVNFANGGGIDAQTGLTVLVFLMAFGGIHLCDPDVGVGFITAFALPHHGSSSPWVHRDLPTQPRTRRPPAMVASDRSRAGDCGFDSVGKRDDIGSPSLPQSDASWIGGIASPPKSPLRLGVPIERIRSQWLTTLGRA